MAETAINLDSEVLSGDEQDTATSAADAAAISNSKFEDLLKETDKNSTKSSKAKIEKARRMEREVTQF